MTPMIESQLQIMHAHDLPQAALECPMPRMLVPIAPFAVTLARGPALQSVNDQIRVVNRRHLADIRLVPRIVRPELRKPGLTDSGPRRVVIVLERSEAHAKVENRG